MYRSPLSTADSGASAPCRVREFAYTEIYRQSREYWASRGDDRDSLLGAGCGV
jgi:hypothetical protein